MSIDELKAKLRQLRAQQIHNNSLPDWDREQPFGVSDKKDSGYFHAETDKALLEFIGDAEVTELFQAVEKRYE